MSHPTSPLAAHSATSSLTDGVVDSRFFATKKISVLLDDTNYLLWRQQVLLAIKTYKLQRFLDTVRLFFLILLAWILVPKSGMPLLLCMAVTTSRLIFYRRALHSQRKGNLSMREFLVKIKGFCANLASYGEVISDHEHVTTILNGLPPEYESVVTIITASSIPYTAQGCCTWLNTSEFPTSINDSLIVLILKDLQPIALCNVIYKIVVEVLTNRLKEIL
ncbi:hypothetical protein PVK06_023090 [Gossypium arboreum]|uniref:Retrovirus-related Pol polyprotein from transposon TNT 1-94 n=1 Tax=Gossypium arboreum TaxID=29729 RepID=A0ABR0PAF5_GOSAR|nr:hypothetical protein PVK06_023090 [Gossypium arboreum]